VRKLVGISQKIKRSWLDALLDRLVNTTDEVELRAFLDNRLKDELPGTESRAKTLGILLRIWGGIPPERISLRDRALALLPRISGQDRIWLHWGMTALAYPFFRDAAEVVGRLLALQDDFTTAQVQGRMLTTWGDRATSKEAAQKLITTFVDWEALRATKTKGHFLQSRKLAASDPDLQLWLLEALLRASVGEEIDARQLLRLPEAFPFSVQVGVADLRNYEGFNIHRQGLDMDIVAPRSAKLEPVLKASKKSQKKFSKVPHASLFEMEAASVVSKEGKPFTVPVISSKMRSAREQREGLDEKHRTEDVIKNEILGTLPNRASRFHRVRGTALIPNGPFAAPSVECLKQFREGRFFGCIALTQAVMEAMIALAWQSEIGKKATHEGT
jgi:hypothetical protein